jgi:phosphopantothenoylcysteine decarboxylase/phosphopantothenate--cysteine ligase
MLKGKHILLGITGSIAAYKSAQIVRLLIKEGAEVKVVMTDKAKEFITPLTMASLSKNPVLVEFFNPENGDWNSHISLGMWADVYLIAPASANTIAKMAYGIADNLLLTTYLSARCKTVVAPAMDVDMFNHPATQSNIEKITERGVLVIEPETGELASGLEGKGRMEEPQKIVKAVEELLLKRQSYDGKTVLITAGPTREPLDPVRYISNHSTGKMGYSIAHEFASRGANVILVSGPVSLTVKHPSIEVISVTTAAEMFETCKEINSNVKIDISVFAAAVADYTPESISDKKIKREGDNISLALQPTQDIAEFLAKCEKRQGVFVGFALETDNEKENAINKLKRKNLDAIILNSLNDEGAGFNMDTNKISIIDKTGVISEFPLKSKSKVASDIADYIFKLL